MSQRNDTATHPTGLSADEAALEKRLQEQFLDAQPGTVIEIPAGRRALDRVLTLRANGVTIRGAAAYIDSTYRHYTASYGITIYNKGALSAGGLSGQHLGGTGMVGVGYGAGGTGASGGSGIGGGPGSPGLVIVRW